MLHTPDEHVPLYITYACYTHLTNMSLCALLMHVTHTLANMSLCTLLMHVTHTLANMSLCALLMHVTHTGEHVPLYITHACYTHWRTCPFVHYLCMLHTPDEHVPLYITHACYTHLTNMSLPVQQPIPGLKVSLHLGMHVSLDLHLYFQNLVLTPATEERA